MLAETVISVSVISVQMIASFDSSSSLDCLVGSTALATQLMVGFSMGAGIEFLHSLQHLMATISSDASLHTIFLAIPHIPAPFLKP